MLRKVLIGAVGLVILTVGGITFALWPVSAPHSRVPVSMQKQLDATVGAAMVSDQQMSLCTGLGAATCTMHCTANVFDMDPATATTIAGVETAYTVATCSEADSDGIDGSEVNVFVVHLAPTVSIVAAGDDAHESDLARIFPKHAVAAAWWFYTDGNPGHRLSWL